MKKLLNSLIFLSLLVLAGCTSTQNENNTRTETKEYAGDPGTRPADDHFLAKGWPDGEISVKAYTKGLQEARTLALAKGDTPGFELDWITRGPANIGARINTFAVHPSDDNIMFAGFSRGGVWRTTNGGVDWEPVFDDQLYLSIGDITFDPNDPNTIYVGTGDPNISASFMIGDGIYRSTDGGDNWENIGWDGLNIITQIRIDPNNADRIYAAAMGVPFERDEVRGLYRTDDGGQNWEQVLFVSDQAGIIDLVMHPENPNILFAAAWDRIRNNQESIVSGPNANIYRSVDGGDTWTLMGNGLPVDNQGRIGLAIAPGNPQVMYASYTGTNNQLFDIFRSTDGGQNWSPVLNPNSESPISPSALGGFGWYFGKIRVNPSDADDIFVLGVNLWRSRDGGENWDIPFWEGVNGVHADKHDLQWDNQGRPILATDGGLYRATDEDYEVWEDIENIPCTQFYRVAVSPHLPGTVFGGAQDNGSTGGNSLEEEWPRIFGGDGFQMVFHPENPGHFFTETQNGNIYVTLDDGFNWEWANEGIDSDDRRNWNMQYILSPHNPDILYTGTYRAYVGFDSQFPQWVPISEDLTDGLVLHPRYHSITAISESLVEEGTIYVGTTDGNVWRGDNQGQTWTPINTGLPDRYVSSIKPSPDDPEIVYVTFSAFKDYDFSPLVFRSMDRGNNWESIAGDLPNLSINDIYIYPGVGDSVLFIGNEGGVYGTTDAGQTWDRVGENMPFVAVEDLEIDLTTNELVAGSYARSILTYPLDSIISGAPPVSTNAPTSLTAELKLAPNPGTGPLTLFWSGLEARDTEVSIMNIRGQQLAEMRFQPANANGQRQLQLTDKLGTGTYFVQIRQGAKQRTLRWIKQ